MRLQQRVSRKTPMLQKELLPTVLGQQTEVQKVVATLLEAEK